MFDILKSRDNFQYMNQRLAYKAFFVVGLSAVSGFLLSTLEPPPTAPLIELIVSVPLALLLWSVFHLVEPANPSRKWVIAELTVVPVVWLLLMLALGVWLFHVWEPYYEHQTTL